MGVAGFLVIYLGTSALNLITAKYYDVKLDKYLTEQGYLKNYYNMLPSSTDRFKEYKKVIIPVYGVFRTIKNLTKLQRLNNEEYYTNALFKWRLDKSIYKLSEEDRQELKKYDCEAIRNQLFSQYCITDNEVYNFDDYLKSYMIDFDAFLSIFADSKYIEQVISELNLNNCPIEFKISYDSVSLKDILTKDLKIVKDFSSEEVNYEVYLGNISFTADDYVKNVIENLRSSKYEESNAIALYITNLTCAKLLINSYYEKVIKNGEELSSKRKVRTREF